jgi:hypothetical protein
MGFPGEGPFCLFIKFSSFPFESWEPDHVSFSAEEREVIWRFFHYRVFLDGKTEKSMNPAQIRGFFRPSSCGTVCSIRFRLREEFLMRRGDPGAEAHAGYSAAA